MKTYKIFVINAGSTSLKCALYENEREIISLKTDYDMLKIKAFSSQVALLLYFRDTLLADMSRNNISAKGIDAFVARGVGMQSCEGGAYAINEAMLTDIRNRPGVDPHLVAVPLAKEFATTYGGLALVIDPEDTDEMQEMARVTGLSTIVREARYHPLNQKAVARRFATDINRRYEDLNLIVAHMGGGISISAHRKGFIVDTSDARQGDGPMSPNRTGALPALPVVKMCFSGKYTEKEMTELITRDGGLVNHLGTDDLRKVQERIDKGDPYASLIFDTMAYQIGKTIGSYAAVLNGKVDAILITGGMANNRALVERITNMVSFIGLVALYPGEFEMEALSSGGLRVLTDQEKTKPYSGMPVWNGFKK